MKVTLFRLSSSDQGTLGKLVTEDFSCYTLEPPWRGNQRSISCIPLGEYEATVIVSSKFGYVYYIKNVDNRSGILIHSGNLAGDVSLGYRTNSNGCILLGERIGTLQGQLAVLLSRPAITKFMSYMNNQNFTLDIIDVLRS